MNKSNWKVRKPRCGILFLECNWFKAVGMGSNAPGGNLASKVQARHQAICRELRADLDIIDPGLVSSVEQLEVAIKLFIQQDADFVLASFMTWAEDFAWVRFLRDFPARIPVLFWCEQKETIPRENNYSSDAFVDFLDNTGLVGSLEGSASAGRFRASGRCIETICGSRSRCHDRIVRFANAAKARAILHRARIGLFQSQNEIMWSTYVDPYRFFTDVGPEITIVSFARFLDAIKAVGDAETADLVAKFRGMYQVNDLADDALMKVSVQASIGLAHLADALRLDGLAFNDVDSALHEMCGLRPGFYHPDFNQNDSVLVPEADVCMAALGLAIRTMLGRPCLFAEPLFLDDARNTFMAGHAGPNNHAIADPESVVIMPDTEYKNADFEYAGAPFACFNMPLGAVTMVHFGPARDSFKIVQSLVESVPITCSLNGYASGNFRPPSPVTEFFEHLLEAGVTQHFLMVLGDWRAQIRDFARVAGFQMIDVS
ncbi:MAG: hypothetical protein JW829_09880 [Pirellulales bacterium]|nr:hypothetical protein [Pirellulales bacterium]